MSQDTVNVRDLPTGMDVTDPNWGAGLGIHLVADLNINTSGGGYPASTQVVHMGPFLRWLDCWVASHGNQAAMLELGWDKNDERRLRRWRIENVHPWVMVSYVEDALNRAGLRLVDVYPETDVGEVTTTWCPTCRDEVVVDSTLVCPWCDSVTQRSVTQSLHHATRGVIEYTLTPQRRASSARKRSKKARYLTDEDLGLARALYQDERLTMKQVSAWLWEQDRGRRHASPERLEEALRRAFRRFGYATRTTRESNKGILFRGALCAGTTIKGEPCGQSATRGSRYCFNHDPDREIERRRRAHMERMRAQRKWVGKRVPMRPFANWLRKRKLELALPVEQRRFKDRDGGLTRLSAATGTDASTLIKWMRQESSKGQPKHLITPEKVKEVLARDGTTAFEGLYPTAATVSELQVASHSLPKAA